MPANTTLFKNDNKLREPYIIRSQKYKRLRDLSRSYNGNTPSQSQNKKGTKDIITKEDLSRSEANTQLNNKKLMSTYALIRDSKNFVRRNELRTNGSPKTYGNFTSRLTSRDKRLIQSDDKYITIDFNEISTSFASPHDEIDLGAQVGKGSFAIVYAGKDLKKNNKNVAIKKYEKIRLQNGSRKDLVENEITILSKLSHPNIVGFHRAFQCIKSVYIIQDLHVNKPLVDYMKEFPRRRIIESESKIIFKQICSAVRHLHDNFICHRDLKCTNLLVDTKDKHSPKIILIDFGFASFSSKKYKSYLGTPSYMAPEIVKRDYYDGYKVDIWALGVILYKILAGDFPFGHEEDLDLERKILKASFEFPANFPIKCKDIVNKCLTVDPSKRITIKDIQNHPWLK